MRINARRDETSFECSITKVVKQSQLDMQIMKHVSRRSEPMHASPWASDQFPDEDLQC
jgi:hypothetical protein